MPDIDTEELRRLTREATPGPWACQPGTPDWEPPIVLVDEGIPVGAGHMEIAEMGQGDEQGLRNGNLIAAMRNALPGILDALDAKDREIERLIATRERLVIERDFEHNRWITDGEDNLAMQAAKEAEIERLRADREMIARCEPYRRSGACHCSTGIPGPCALEASEEEGAGDG